VIYRTFYASKVFLRDVVSCQSTDLSFLLAVLFLVLCVYFAANKLFYLLTYNYYIMWRVAFTEFQDRVASVWGLSTDN